MNCTPINQHPAFRPQLSALSPQPSASRDTAATVMGAFIAVALISNAIMLAYFLHALVR